MYGDRRGACQAVLSRRMLRLASGRQWQWQPLLLLAALSLSGAWVWSLEAAHAQELAKLQATVSIQALRMSELVDKLNASELGEGSSSWRPLKSNVMMWKSNVMMCSAIWSAQNLHPFAAQPTEPTVTAAAGRRSGSPRVTSAHPHTGCPIPNRCERRQKRSQLGATGTGSPRRPRPAVVLSDRRAPGSWKGNAGASVWPPIG